MGIALSHDGSRMAFSAGAKAQIYIRELDQLEARPIPGAEGGVAPSFSSDGQWLLFLVGDRLKKIPISGGVAQDVPTGERGVISPASWDRGDSIWFGTSQGLMRVPARGGAPEIMVKIDTIFNQARRMVLFLARNHCRGEQPSFITQESPAESWIPRRWI